MAFALFLQRGILLLVIKMEQHSKKTHFGYFRATESSKVLTAKLNIKWLIRHLMNPHLK
jgi:hypothetical protein